MSDRFHVVVHMAHRVGDAHGRIECAAGSPVDPVFENQVQRLDLARAEIHERVVQGDRTQTRCDLTWRGDGRSIDVRSLVQSHIESSKTLWVPGNIRRFGSTQLHVLQYHDREQSPNEAPLSDAYIVQLDR